MPFPRNPSSKISHYYGDTVRKLFVSAGIILLVTLPVFRDLLQISAFTFILAVVVLIIFAGLTNPKLRWVNIVDVIISTLGVVVFEYLAIANYASDWTSFFTSQVLAIIFLFALYFSAKTARAVATGQVKPNTFEEDLND